MSAIAAVGMQSVVYFAQNRQNGTVKIGFTTDLKQRLSGLETACGVRLHIMRQLTGGRACERWFHKHFAHLRVQGEWFSYHDEMLTVRAPDEITTPLRQMMRRDVRLSLKERLTEADRQAADLGLTAQQQLLLIATSVRDEEAKSLLQALRDEAERTSRVA